MNAEDQTAMVAIALADAFGENNVTDTVDFEADPNVGTVEVTDLAASEVAQVEDIVAEHASKERDRHDINLDYTVEDAEQQSDDRHAVTVSGIMPRRVGDVPSAVETFCDANDHGIERSPNADDFQWVTTFDGNRQRDVLLGDEDGVFFEATQVGDGPQFSGTATDFEYNDTDNVLTFTVDGRHCTVAPLADADGFILQTY